MREQWLQAGAEGLRIHVGLCSLMPARMAIHQAPMRSRHRTRRLKSGILHKLCVMARPRSPHAVPPTHPSDTGIRVHGMSDTNGRISIYLGARQHYQTL
jgi:hypothetical protein